MSRIDEIWRSTPLCTAGLIIFNVAIHTVIFLTSWNVGMVAIIPSKVVVDHQFYRLISSNFIHGGILHILMNMMSLLQIGMVLETQFGTLQLLYLTLWMAPLCGIIYTTICMLTHSDQAAVGFSAVLFGYALLESYHTTATSRTLWCVTVPAKLYPWALLIAIQFMMPNISFIGHLSGILVGLLTATGVLQYILPSQECFRYLEDISYLSPLTKQTNYIRCTDKSFTSTSAQSIQFIGFIYWCGVQVWNVVATILFVCGIRAERISFSWPTLSFLRSSTSTSNSYSDVSSMPSSTGRTLAADVHMVTGNNANINTNANTAIPGITSINSMTGRNHNYSALNQSDVEDQVEVTKLNKNDKLKTVIL